MNIPRIVQTLAADTAAASVSTTARCEAANFRWESAVSDLRAAEYGAYIGAVGTHEDWKAEHKGYVTDNVHIAKDLPLCAESFREINTQAHLNEAMDNAFLLRLESLGGLASHPLLSADVAQRFWDRFYGYQGDLRKDTLISDSEKIRAELVQ